MNRRRLVAIGVASISAAGLGAAYLYTRNDFAFHLSDIELMAASSYFPATWVKPSRNGPYLTKQAKEEITSSYKNSQSVNIDGILVFWDINSN